jgi:DNA-binding response OmpR family regulator
VYVTLPSGTGDRPVVLVVDDEQAVADTYALRLEKRYETRVAYGGEEALEKVDDGVDAVLLDRRMPDIHGDDVLAEIRDRGLTCKVIMATAVDPDLNILEMDFDDYLCKPIFQDTLFETLEQHISGTSGEERGLDEFFSIVSKLSVLEDEKTPAQLEASAEYTALKRRADELGSDLQDEIDDFDEIIDTYREINRNS